MLAPWRHSAVDSDRVSSRFFCLLFFGSDLFFDSKRFLGSCGSWIFPSPLFFYSNRFLVSISSCLVQTLRSVFILFFLFCCWILFPMDPFVSGSQIRSSANFLLLVLDFLILNFFLIFFDGSVCFASRLLILCLLSFFRSGLYPCVRD